MKESVFSKQLRDDIKEYFDDEVHVNLLPDMRRTGKKPYDFYFLKDNFYAFELKVETGKSFSFNKVKPHQPECLKEVYENGGVGVFVICFPKKKIAFILSPTDWEDAVEHNKSLDRNSVPYEYFFNNYFYFVRKKTREKTRWDVETLWAYIKC